MSNFYTFEKDRYHQVQEIDHWCTEKFGVGKWIYERTPKSWEDMPRWTVHSMFSNTTFAFREQDDYFLFLLKWV